MRSRIARAALAIILALIARAASSADLSVTATSRLKTAYVFSIGFPATTGPVVANDVTTCYESLCLNLWGQKSLDGEENSLGNEVDGPDVWYTFNMAGFAITPEYNRFYIRPLGDKENDLHSLQVNIARSLGNDVTIYFKPQEVFVTGNGFPEGGTYLSAGLTKAYVYDEVSFGLKTELVHDTGAVGAKTSTSARFGFYPSIPLGDRVSLDLGVDWYPQLSGDPNHYGNHWVGYVGMTWKIVVPKPTM